MSEPVKFPFLPVSSRTREVFLQPLLPFNLRRPGRETVLVHGLLDSGAAVNVLPYGLGLRLGAVWEAHTARVTLTGNLFGHEARALLADAEIADFPPVRLVFAWVQSDSVPLLLGVNFFQEFDICFRRAAWSLNSSPQSNSR